MSTKTTNRREFVTSGPIVSFPIRGKTWALRIVEGRLLINGRTTPWFVDGDDRTATVESQDDPTELLANVAEAAAIAGIFEAGDYPPGNRDDTGLLWVGNESVEPRMRA